MSRWLSIALAIISCLTVHGGDDAPASPAPVELTVMTYNLHAGADATIDEIAAVINAESPDFVALQEVDVCTQRANAPHHNDINMVARLAAATNMFPLYGRTLNFAGGYYGIALLSKHPCAQSVAIDLPNPEGVEPRVLLEGVFLIDGKTPVIVASTHLSVESLPTRLLQARHIADRYADAERPVILGGDFNSTPDSDAVQTMSAVLANLTGTQPTFPASEPAKTLDYIFGSQDIEINESRVITDADHQSDHCPVVANITITP